MSDQLELCVAPEDTGRRLDVWLASELEELSRARVQSLIKSGAIRFANGSKTKANIKTTEGMKLTVELPDAAPVAIEAEDIPLDIIHEDSEIIVVNKPAGLVVHPAPGHASGTLVNALLFHCDDLAGVGGEIRPGIVHRLDRDTSGVMIVAKSQAAMDSLSLQFSERKVSKEYIAIVNGVPHPGIGRIETEIGRSSHDRKKMSVNPSSQGRIAISNYHVMEVMGDYCCMRVGIETGRTHQIRVHMAHIGHHIVGDRVYGKRGEKMKLPITVKRQMLHAAKLTVFHPSSGEAMTFEAAPAADIVVLLDALRGSQKVRKN
jgi:23S rRNA pseudouridine1911/1915/1917 synthase